MSFSVKRRIQPAAIALVLCFVGVIAAGAQQSPEEQGIIEGVVFKTGTGQPFRGARITLRRADATDAAGLDSLPDLKPGTPGEGPVGFSLFLGNGPGGPAGPGGPGALSTSSDAMGRFTLTDVAPGDYRISAQAEGYLIQEYGQRTATGPGAILSVAAGKRVTVEFRLMPASVISGRVYDAEGEPMLKATVQAYAYRYTDDRRTLASAASTQTNDLGEYRLYWLPPGNYFIAVTPRNRLPANESATDPGLPLPTAGRNMQFIAVAGNGQGPSLLQMLAAPGADSTAIYFPGVVNPADAEAVRVGASTEVPGIDFHLRPLRTVTVSGRIPAPFSLGSAAIPPRPETDAQPRNPASRGAAQANVEITVQTGPAGVFQATPGVSVSGARLAMAGPPIELTLTRMGTPAAGPAGRASAPVRADGTFQFDRVTAGSYSLVAIAKDPNGKQHTARMSLEAGSDDIRDLVVGLQPGHDMRGQIYVDPPPPDGFKVTSLRVSLTPDSAPINLPPLPGGSGDFVMAIASPGGVFPGGDTISAAVAEDGSFVLKDVAAALDYRVRVTGLPSGGYLQDGRLGSADGLGAPVNGADPEASLRLQLGFSGGAASGTVIDAAGSRYATAVVALVPDKSHSGRADLYFSTTSDSEGRYSFSNVPPGAYRLFAWTEIPSGAFRSPEFLKDYEERAITGAIEKRGAWSETLKLIPTTTP